MKPTARAAALAALVLGAGLVRAQQAAYPDDLRQPMPNQAPQTSSSETVRGDVFSAAPIEGTTPAEPEKALRAAYKPGMGALIESLSSEPTDFNFKDADILGVLRSFALRFNKNIIAAPGVSGKVNIHLKNVPFDEGFRTMLTQMNLVAVQKSANVIEIIRVSQMPVLSQVFMLKYRFAAELSQSIQGMLSTKERETTGIAVDAASNSLIVTSTNDMLQKVKSMVDALDIETPQIAIKARLIETGASNQIQIGNAFSGSRSFARDGMSGTGRAFNNFTNFGQNPQTGAVNLNQALTFFPSGGLFDYTAVLGRTQFYALLNLLQTDSKAKTISEPMILTGNNKSSKIHVGQNLPVKVLIVNQTSTVQEIRYIPEGVDLDVTPIVSPGSDVISFKIRVGVSELLGFQDGAPIVTERVASTEVSVKSGDTVVIGGLMKDKMTDTDSGIPLLKSIPVLGYLFKNKRKIKDRTELLIFITPELVVRGRSLVPAAEERR